MDEHWAASMADCLAGPMDAQMAGELESTKVATKVHQKVGAKAGTKGDSWVAQKGEH